MNETRGRYTLPDDVFETLMIDAYKEACSNVDEVEDYD